MAWLAMPLLAGLVVACSGSPAEVEERAATGPEATFEIATQEPPSPQPEALTLAPQAGTAGSAECPGYPEDFELAGGTEVVSVPLLDEPPARQWARDPAFGTCLVRVTDRGQDLATDDPSTGMLNEYARVDSYNADGSRLLARGTDGTWYLYDARSLQPLGPVSVDVEPRWDAGDPDLLYYTDETSLRIGPRFVLTAFR